MIANDIKTPFDIVIERCMREYESQSTKAVSKNLEKFILFMNHAIDLNG